jgi:arylsulfatase A-like enzyme
MLVSRRNFLSAAAASAVAPQIRAQPSRPNILFILADDLGYGDLGCYGQKKIATPNLDHLASEGVRFTQAYAGSTVCAPSRCALMTGLHTGHGRIRGNDRSGLQPTDTTIASLLKRAGYATGLVGKWGLGAACSPGVPNRQGFDYFFGYLDQRHAHTYYPTSMWENEAEFFLDRNFGDHRTQYSQDLFTERALRFLDQHKSEPFFLYLAYTTPHANNELTRESGNGMQVPSDAPYSDRDWPQPDRNFAAMVTRLDRDVGAILARLKHHSLDSNTLVIFASDNGPHREGGNHPEFFGSSGPLRGIKRDLYEGGIRVPAIARWPGVVPAGRSSDQVWAFWDFLPTSCELAGISAPQNLDGVSIAPALKGKSLAERPPLYWEFHEKGFFQAVRIGDWKGVRRQSIRGPIELYDLASDLGESADVASSHPDIVRQIAGAMRSLRSDSPEYPVTR